MSLKTKTNCLVFFSQNNPLPTYSNFQQKKNSLFYLSSLPIYRQKRVRESEREREGGLRRKRNVREMVWVAKKSTKVACFACQMLGKLILRICAHVHCPLSNRLGNAGPVKKFIKCIFYSMLSEKSFKIY